MKKQGMYIGVLSFAFSVIFLFLSSATMAGTQDGVSKDLVSAPHLEASSVVGQTEKKDHGISPLPTVFVPLKEGLHAFLDLASPQHQFVLPKDNRTDYRAVVGFHFRLR